MLWLLTQIGQLAPPICRPDSDIDFQETSSSSSVRYHLALMWYRLETLSSVRYHSIFQLYAFQSVLCESPFSLTDNDTECLDQSHLHPSQLRTPDTTWLYDLYHHNIVTTSSQYHRNIKTISSQYCHNIITITIENTWYHLTLWPISSKYCHNIITIKTNYLQLIQMSKLNLTRF